VYSDCKSATPLPCVGGPSRFDHEPYNRAMSQSKWFSWATAIIFLTFGGSCVGQTAHPAKKPAPKPQISSSSFACPDAEAQKACKSYDELLKAKDTSLPTEGYICFRENDDEFFVISVSKPYFRKRWDRDLKQMVVDDETTSPGRGSARTYKDGVEVSGMMPSLSFKGKWYPYPESGMFSSDEINFKKQDDSNRNVGVSIDENQVNVGYEYQNTSDKPFTYNLTIQRSTGRFSESFQEQSEHVPLLEGTGRCIYRR
jgi:hypothetical protein